MGLLLFLVAGGALAALIVMDVFVIRVTERDLHTTPATLVADPPITSAMHMGGFLSAAVSILNLPATLAPVILVALATQQHPIGGDGMTEIAGVLVAAFSFSVSIKMMRISDVLAEGIVRFLPSLFQSILYCAVWTMLVLALLGLTRPSGHVASLVYVYAGVMIGFTLSLAWLGRHVRTWAQTPKPA